MGSLVVLLVAGSVVWLLLRQAGRARSRAQWAAAQVSTHEWVRSLVQNSSNVITVVDAEGTILYQTPSVKQVFGYDAATLVGTQLQCDLGQGFWFARPLEVEAATQLLADQAAAQRRGEFVLLPAVATAS